MKKESVRIAFTFWTAMSLAGAALTGAVLSGCDTGTENGDPARFRYDSATGECRNGHRQIGFNTYSIRELRASLNAECIDLSWMELTTLIEDSTFDNDSLVGWNFKGALFMGSALHFNGIIDAQLQGADMSGVRFGYVHTTGTFDRFTKPPSPDCEMYGNRIDCLQ